MLVSIRMNDNLNNYFITTQYIENKEYKYNTETLRAFSDLNKLFKPYLTADVVFIDSDPIIRSIFENRMKNYKIKTNEKDEGRKIKIVCIPHAQQLIKYITVYKYTYGIIIINENLGPDSFTGTETIKKIRGHGYQGPAFISVGNYSKDAHKPFIESVKSSGSNGIIIKNNNDFFEKITQILEFTIARNI